MTQETPETETTRASLELLYHVSRELASNLDLRTVLERVLFLAMRYTKAIRGSIIVLDDNERPLESAVISGGQVMDRSTQRLRSTLDHGLAGWVVRHKEPALVVDTGLDERWTFLKYEKAEENAGSKSAVSAPLMVRDRLVGVITLVHPQPNYFTKDHLTLVETIAEQAGIAVLNARLYTESQRQVRVMSALAETAATITASLNLEDVFLRILDQIIVALSVQAVCLALVEADHDEMVVRAAKGWENTQPTKKVIKVGQGISGWVAQEGKALIVHEAAKDDRFDHEVVARTGLDIKAIACAPLKYHGHVIGVIEAINPKEGAFDSDALLLLTGIGGLAGTAVRHAQLFERLQAAHQSYRELFEDSIDSILITNWLGTIVEANRKAILSSGYDKETLRSTTVQQLHMIDVDQVGEKFEKLTSESTISYESRMRTRSGHEIPVRVYVHQVNIEGTPLVQWILRDITESKNLDNLREDLISMIYHDLRSPLANVVSSLDILSTLLPEDDETLPSLVSIALRSTERIQRLTNSLLDISRLEAGQPVGNRQQSPILPIIQEAYELVQPLAENKDQHINLILPEKLPNVFVDIDMIRRVIVNLLENASKYTPPGSMVQLGAKTVGDFIQVWVQDDGPGIPASEQERIFSKFTRLGNRETASKGLGLGLAYCRLTVEAHKGSIWVESEPGNGARFIFQLPIFASDEALIESN
jgi:PAS domain S-box-containing protein